MRNVILLTVGALLALGPCSLGQTTATTKVRALYKQGLQAMEQGEVATARACFQEVLRLQPGSTSARYQLKQLSLRGGKLAAKKRENLLKKVRLPAVNFDELTLPEALDALEAHVLKQTEKKFSPNFIVQDPDSVLDERKFSLKLANLPASIVLQYCLENGRASARYDQHAIVIKPLAQSRRAPREGENAPAKQRSKKAADPFGR